MDDEDLATLEALEALPRRSLTSTERVQKKRRLDFLKADAELYNRLVAQYGRRVTDFLIEHGFTPRVFIAEETPILDDLDLFREATPPPPPFAWDGRVSSLIGKERLALECWLWETHDRSGRLGRPDPQGGKKGARNPDRWKPNKSTDHDRPWPAPPFSPLARWIAHGAVLDLGGYSKHAPRNWSPRRWFGPGQSAPPLQISIARALGLRAQLDAEYDEEAFLTAEVLPEQTKRNHPNPGGFYGPKRGWWGPETEPGRSLLGGPQPVEYCSEIDEPPPKSVLLQTHEPPDEIISLLRRSPTTEEALYNALRRYRLKWERAGRPAYRVRAKNIGRWSAPRLEEIVTPAWVMASPALVRWFRRLLIISRVVPHIVGEKLFYGDLACWWEVPSEARGHGATRYTYWNQHIFAVCEGTQWPTKPQRRPRNAPYAIELVWDRQVRADPGMARVEGPAGPRVVAAACFKMPDLMVAREVLRSPFYPRGFPSLWRPNRDAKRWAAIVPDKPPGEWARENVEKPANALSIKRKRLAPLRRLIRERLPDDDPLDRLATSAAIEAGL
jgi:hypothetical protein